LQLSSYAAALPSQPNKPSRGGTAKLFATPQARRAASTPELGFFDSLHAAIAIEEGLKYGDLDKVLRSAVGREPAEKPQQRRVR
jgi:hypothetical protein